MGFSIEFEPDALKDWHKLQPAQRERFKRMLAKREDYLVYRKAKDFLN